MLFTDLYRECKRVNLIDAFYMPVPDRTCKSGKVIILCLKIVRKMIPNKFCGVIIIEQIDFAIKSVENQCQKKDPETAS